MKLFNSILLTLIGLLILTTSCNKQKSYADRLKDERKAIDRLITERDFNILTSFPSNGEFGDNDFYKDPSTGVYFNIIDYGDAIYGDSTTIAQFREKVFIRFEGLHYFMSKDTTRYTNYHSVSPEELEYVGPVSSMTRNSYTNAGWAVPLSYVGHRGKVKMIIPFEVGSTYDQNEFQPTYYDLVEYRFSTKW